MSADVAKPSESVTAEVQTLFSLAWPSVLAQLGTMLMGVVDTMMVGHVTDGETALAAIGLGSTWSFATIVVAMGAAAGLDPLFSQAFGAGNKAEAGRTLRLGLIMLFTLSIPVMWFHQFADVGLRLFGQPEPIVEMATAYCRVLMPSTPLILGFGVFRQFLQAQGKMWPGAVAVAAANVLNFLLNLILVYGVGTWEGLGPVGSGWATSSSRLVMFGVVAAYSWPIIRSTPAPGWWSWQKFGRIALIGLPVGLQVGMEVWAFNATTLMMGWFDGPLAKTAVAAHFVALNIASVSFMVPFGISSAASARVGNLLGAGLHWQRTAWTAVACGAGVMSFSAIAFMAFPRLLVSLFTTDYAVVPLAASLLPIASLFQLFDGTQAVAFGVLRGAGDTRVPALANVVGYYIIGLPLGAWLAFSLGYGPRGLWAGLTVGLACVATLLLLRLRLMSARGGYRVV